MPADPRRPLIVDIKRHSLNDGPGIRTAVFFKGCPLRCTFCHNPETQDPRAEIVHSESQCVSCASCVAACPRGALDSTSPGRIRRDRCDRCERCVDVCPTGALQVVGRYYPVEKLVEIVLRDVPYYLPSAGGVTLTGGECTLYPDYLESLLILLKRHHVHVVLETAGSFDYEVFRQQVLPYLDLVYFDVKFADPALHQQHTGFPNGPILHNLARLLKEPGVALQARVPLVPGVTATDDNLREIARLLREMGAKEASLLPYNPLGLEMWGKLGKRRPALSPSFMPAHREEALGASFQAWLQATATPAD